MTLELALLLVGAYLLGSIPFGVFIARARGVDITKIGKEVEDLTSIIESEGFRDVVARLVEDRLRSLPPASPTEPASGIGAVENFEEVISTTEFEERHNKLAAYGCLDDDSGVQGVAELRLIEQRFENSECDVFQRISFHVEIHKNAELSRALKQRTDA